MGRRKTAVARVRLFPNGDGTVTVNGKNSRVYFGDREALTATGMSPLRLLDLTDAYNMTARVVGGGTSGQAGAIRHARSRALVRAKPECQAALRKAGFLPRDTRMKESRKPDVKR